MSEQTYVREQAKLRRQTGEIPTEGEADDDFHIDVPQGLPEVNPEVYRDVEPLLFKGFLYVPALINDVPFVFKSLNHHEFELLNLMGGDFQKNTSHKALQKQFNLFLAFGVLMMDGVSILPDRDRHLDEIAKMFGSLHESVRRKVIHKLSEINRRANRAVILSEPFSLESQSRLRWAQYKGTTLTTSSVTGLSGTEALGMNWGQLIWRAVNYFEDQREFAEREWENAKFVASAMAGKGMQKVHSQDKQRRKREREERLDRRDKILRLAILNEAPTDSPQAGTPIKVARTVEELATQLERDLKGEKDWHDVVVDQMERRSKEEHRARLEVIRQKYEAHQAEYGPKGLVGGTEASKGLTSEEVQFRIDRRRQLTAQRLAAQATVPELHDPKMAHFLDKWAQDEGAPQQVAPLRLADRHKSIPFRRGDR